MKIYREEDKKLIGIFIAILVYGVIICLTVFIKHLLLTFISDKGTADLIASLIEGLVAYVAALLVWIELRSSEKNGVYQSELTEAEFILNYNQAFIQNSEMYYVENNLSRWMETGDPNYCQKDKDRQMYVNYLVYLEALGDLVNRNILSLDHIDDLMAYRFFIAVNNPEIQKKELCLYPEYYRNCFKAYAKWSDYRKKNNREILLEEYSLDKWYAFEKYAGFNVDVCELNNEDDLRFAAALIYDTDKYIYPAAFNSRKNAMNVIPGLMKENGIFNISNYHVAKINGKIMGIALVIDEPEKTAVPNFLNREYEKSAIDVNEKYFSKIRSIVAGSRKPVYIACICTDKKSRGQRIGTILLKNILEKYKDRYIVLDVLTENYTAVKLYKKYDFKVESVGTGYAYKMKAPECLKMIHNPINQKEKNTTIKVKGEYI